MVEGGGSELIFYCAASGERRKMPCRLGMTRTEQLPSSKSSPPFTVSIWLFGTPLSLAKFAVLSVPITNAPVLLAM